MAIDRRLFLAGLGVAAVGAAAWKYVPRIFEAPLSFEAMADPEGFRKIEGGKRSAAFDPFFGLSPDEVDPGEAVTEATVRQDICGALYGGNTVPSGVVRIASFSDYYCPYCRVQTQKLARLEENSSGGIEVVWHELPLLGETSDMAAKAALAAKRQGAYVLFHKRLMKSAFRPTPEYLRLLSKDIGIDHDQMAADMASASVEEELRTSAALARIFAFVGTPALVVGKTVIQGQISDRTIERLIELEREEGVSATCATA
ncbi:DsbA family protein [Tropicimonas sp. TH_r6]|uniref:DsbA family protein n=1 Tax=Tropicimonas sp. TH_r6 TaxID=3082085 RepID=UPI00295430B6|nr:DsbA family protein [Tropicimonas sp. TH_r6]MDV7142986.1 DsbA family protein [Tropicimonas sp. TH_r6]